MTTDLRPGEFYGMAESLEAAGVLLSVVAHDRERRLPLHAHAWPFTCLLLEGRYEEEAAGQLICYDPLTPVFHPAGLAHADVVYPGTRMFTVEFSGDWLEVLRTHAPRGQSLYTHTGAEPLWIVLRLYEALRTGTLSAFTVQTLCYEFAGTFDRLDASGDRVKLPWIGRLRAILDQRYDQHLDLRAIAAEVGVHPVYLSRAFRSTYKVNAGDYVHRRRIQQACRILRESNASIASISEDLGYTDQSHFSRTFRTITGKTPAAYRLRR